MRGRGGAKRGMTAIEALAKSCPVPFVQGDDYTGRGKMLVLYGGGAPDRQAAMRQHRGTWVALDLGYWNRDATMRVSINSLHPAPELMRDFGPERFAASGLKLREDADPAGPIIIIGMGNKSRETHGGGWERRALERVRAVYPGRPVVFRPKNRSDSVPMPGCQLSDPTRPIVEVLRGASLVVCRHSNVAVDACLAGVPVVCEDGAARALYGCDLAAPINPSAAERLAFLERLAWWQWNFDELKRGAFWNWLQQLVQFEST